MRTILLIVLSLGMCWGIAGCGPSAADKALDKAAPPPGPDADLNPHIVTNKKIPKPPSAGGLTGGTEGK
ncbi:MAG TPA: hypothetical protein VHE55_04690 [Fimbriimonadaceae bacterium]|nr:hypothetical protein [Fimbriimonadaceae bacterium]